MRRHLLVSALALTALFHLPSSLEAQMHRLLVTQQLDTAAAFLRSNGYSVDASAAGRSQVVGLLPVGGVVYLEIELTANSSYMIIGSCDSDCTDLNLQLTDESGDLIAEDMQDDDVPILEFVAPRTKRYLLGVGMAGCDAEACFFGFQVMRKAGSVS